MSQWQIDPAGVQAVLQSVETAQIALSDALSESAFQGVFDGLTWGGGVTSVVPEALSALMSDQQANLTTITQRINAGVVGVANATVAYNHGQEDMVASFQAELLETAVDGDFSYFDEHGFQG